MYAVQYTNSSSNCYIVFCLMNIQLNLTIMNPAGYTELSGTTNTDLRMYTFVFTLL